MCTSLANTTTSSRSGPSSAPSFVLSLFFLPFFAFNYTSYAHTTTHIQMPNQEEQGEGETLAQVRQRIMQHYQCSEEEADTRIRTSALAMLGGPPTPLPAPPLDPLIPPLDLPIPP